MPGAGTAGNTVSVDVDLFAIAGRMQRLKRLDAPPEGLTESQHEFKVAEVLKMAKSVSSVMIKYGHFLKTAIPYVINFEEALKLLERLVDVNPAAEVLVHKCEEHPSVKKSNLLLRDLLIKPVQRVCKYPLLFREIIHFLEKVNAPEDCLAMAQKAIDALKVIAEQVNKMKKLAELANPGKLAELKAKLRPKVLVDALDLGERTRRLFARVRSIWSSRIFTPTTKRSSTAR